MSIPIKDVAAGRVDFADIQRPGGRLGRTAVGVRHDG
jgi:hypothetical protein